MRKIIYTTDAIESLNSQMWKPVGDEEYFPGDEASIKLIHLSASAQRQSVIASLAILRKCPGWAMSTSRTTPPMF